MLTLQANNVQSAESKNLYEAGLAKLRSGTNPFAFSAATAGTEDACLDIDVPELFDSQRSDLKAIIELFRAGTRPSQLFPILGDPGTGKTHLLNTLQAELRRAAIEEGNECLLIVADHFTVGVDVVDFFLWQIVNHLLAKSEFEKPMLQVVSERLTARLLGEALRQLPPHQQVRLVRRKGILELLRAVFRKHRLIQKKLEAIRRLIGECDVMRPTDLRGACDKARVGREQAYQVIESYLERVEPKDVAGSMRRKLYARFAAFTLLDDQEGIEEGLTEEFRTGPAHITNAGQLTRRLLTTLLEIFRALKIPVVLVFDQLEDFLVASAEGERKELWNSFAQALTSLINNVPGLCLLVFAEKGLWNDRILASIQPYALARLKQEFTLPGRPSQNSIPMPNQYSRLALTQLIQKRIRATVGNFDSTGLPASFPFTEEHVRELVEKETTLRMCLQKLKTWFNELVFPGKQVETPGSELPPNPTTVGSSSGTVAPDEGLMTQLKTQWQLALAGPRKQIQSTDEYSVALIPEFQAALDRWLTYLRDQGITGAGPWSKVEVINDTAKGPFGYLNVIRLENPDAPGVGIATWVAEKARRPIELEKRIEFFGQVPCPVRTLVLFRRDGEEAIAGKTKDIFDRAIKKGRDIRVKRFEKKQVESLLAFPRWLQAVKPNVEAAGETGQVTQRVFVNNLSNDLIQWIDSWRQPLTGGGSNEATR